MVKTQHFVYQKLSILHSSFSPQGHFPLHSKSTCHYMVARDGAIQKGFTLIELLVVMGVIGTLAAGLVVIMNPTAMLAKARDAQRKNDLNQIQQALETYYDDYNSYPAALSDLSSSTATYMEVIPNDPVDSKYKYTYTAFNGGQMYRLYSYIETDSDPNICSGARCPNATPNACASAVDVQGECRFGVSSPNTSP